MDPLPSPAEFGQLRAFVAVAEALSFSRAAAALGITPSALSQTVRALEERLGVRLLNRTTRSVSLTEAGAGLLHRAGPALGLLGAALGQAGRQGGRPSGVVRVLSFRSGAERHLRPMLRGFHEAYPEIVLDLTLDEAVIDFVAAGYDAAIRVGEVIERDHVALRLGPDLTQIAVAAPDYLARHGAPASPRDLTRHRCIGWRWPGQAQPYKWEFQENGRWFAVEVTGPIVTSSRDFAVEAAIDGLGIAFAVREAVAAPLAEGRLVPLLEAWSAPFPGLHLCYPAQRQMAPALRAFVDALAAEARRAA